jgi:4-aminobutyrate aminotransferase-like enzyme
VRRAHALNVAGAYAFGHHSHEKNPVTARATPATLEVIEREGPVENAARVGAHGCTTSSAATPSSATRAGARCCSASNW